MADESPYHDGVTGTELALVEIHTADLVIVFLIKDRDLCRLLDYHEWGLIKTNGSPSGQH